MKIVWVSRWYDIHGYYGKIVKYEDGSQKTVFQHREVMEEHLGRALTEDEVVHHKDENRKNNKIENLEVLSASEHAKLHATQPEMVSLICIHCGSSFDRRAAQERHNRGQGKSGPFCGKSCAGKASGGGQRKPVRHGTLTGYRRGCRCEECRTARREAARHYRAKKRCPVV